MKPLITYTIACITDVYISRLLYTLYKYSDPDSFRIIVMDQCKDGFRPEIMEYVKPLIHLYMHPHRNLGYAKAHNEMLIHALHWKTPYICVSNDDIEIMDSRWLQGIWDTFAKSERIVGVCPMTPRVAGWGYGVPGYPEVLPYKDEYTAKDYEYLLKGDFSNQEDILPKTMPKDIGGTMVDGAVYVMPYFKREVFASPNIGLLDERFFPGSGEDMDHMARIYAQNKRVVSTSLSWVWHWWSKSKDLFASGELEDKYYKNRPYWNNIEDIWRPQDNEGARFDPWASYTAPNGIKRKLKRTPEVVIEQI